jgi:hypothetical protein
MTAAYQFGLGEKGPWMDMGAMSAQEALEQGRAMFADQTFIYVAKMSPIPSSELLPNPGQFWGDTRERAYDLYGSPVVAQLEELGWEGIYGAIEDAVKGYLEKSGASILVPRIVRRYGREGYIQPKDFTPSLKELMR